MPASTATAVRRQLAAGMADPVYLIVGDDDREAMNLASAFADLVEDELKAFNVQRFYAGDRDVIRAVVDAARVLPMLAPRRVVILLRAEKVLKSKRREGTRVETADAVGADEDSRGGLEPLERYIQRPEPLTTLVLIAADANKTTRLVKLLYRQATVVECWGLKEGRDVKGWELPGILRKAEAWVRRAAADAGRRADPDAARLLAERAGTDTGRLRADLERVLLFSEGRTRVTVADVQAVIGAETLQDHWAIVAAIEQGRADQALRQLALAIEAGAVPYLLLGQLGWFVREKLPLTRPAQVVSAVDALLRTDLDLKSSGGDPRVLLERLVVELCGRPERGGEKPSRRQPLRGG